jgi:hypothetical protein
MSRGNLLSFGVCIFTIIFFFISSPIHAEERPIQLSLVTPIQIFPEEDAIAGIRLNLLYGRNVSVTGVDLGLVNHCTGGISKGFQHGLVGLVESDFVGWQNNAVNITRGDFEGLQWGFMNYAGYANGLQLGIVNYAERLKGLQIGFVNIIEKGGQFPVFPIVNWSFDMPGEY